MTPLSELPPPPPTAFDGIIDGAVSKVRQRLPSMGPMQRMMAQSVLSGLEPTAEALGELTLGSRVSMDTDPREMMFGMLAAMAGGADRLPAELEEIVTEDPEAVMAMMMAMLGSGDDDDDKPTIKKKAGKGQRKRKAWGHSKKIRFRRGGGGSAFGVASSGFAPPIPFTFSVATSGSAPSTPFMFGAASSSSALSTSGGGSASSAP